MRFAERSLILAVLALVGQLIALDPATGEVLDEAWFRVTVADKPAGLVHSLVERDAWGMVTTTVESEVAVTRDGTPVHVRVVERWTEGEDGRPVSYRRTSDMAIGSMDLDVVVRGDTLLVTVSCGDEVARSAEPAGGVIVFPEGVRGLLLAHGLSSGGTFSYRIFDPDFLKVALVTVEALGRDTPPHVGDGRELRRARVASDLSPGLETLTWYDDEGRLWLEEVPALGIVTARAAGPVSLADDAAVDVVSAYAIAIPAEIEEPTEVDAALYEFWMEGADVSEMAIEDGRQSVIGRTERGVLLRVDRIVPGPETVARPPAEAEWLAEYLEPSPVVQSAHPPLVRAAREVVGDAGGDAWEAARRIERFVRTAIETKELGIAFASAREVFERRSGDCTEHAVLATAMARSVGVPAKVVGGIVPSGNRFVYHVWLEVWTGGAWYALDPTIGEGSVDATHVKLAESSLAGGRLADLSLGVLRALNRLRVTPVSYTKDGVTVRP